MTRGSRLETARKAFMSILIVFAAFQQACRDEDYAPSKWTSADIRKVRSQLAKYYASNGRFPTEAEGLRVLGEVPRDSWKHEFIYRFPGKRHPEAYDLFSVGPDRQKDTADDVWGSSKGVRSYY